MTDANAAAARLPGESTDAYRDRIFAAITSGSLAATNPTRLDLSGLGISELPDEIGTLSSLEFLNLGKNPLSTLPSTFAGLTSLKILFFLGCEFTKVPEVLGEMKSLYMLSFKANKVEEVPAASIPYRTLGWLILSDNNIQSLPDTVGKCENMRKLLLAGNKLTNAGLPDNMAHMTKLELIRLADNNLAEVPAWIASHPSLAWVALAANPATEGWSEDANARAMLYGASFEGASKVDVPVVDWSELGVDEDEPPLGSGASGAVYAATDRNGSRTAVKVYNLGGKTSDGRPRDEMAASVLASRTGCRSIVRTTARFVKKGSGEDSRVEDSQVEGLVMEYLDPGEWHSLGGPPSFDTVTRDVYPAGVSLDAAEVVAVARGLASAGAALHGAGAIHGDMYAHNVLFRSSKRGVPAAKLGDFGAAFFYPPGSEIGREFERTEARAWGIAATEALELWDGTGDRGPLDALKRLALECVGERGKRPSFAEIVARVGEPEGV